MNRMAGTKFVPTNSNDKQVTIDCDWILILRSSLFVWWLFSCSPVPKVSVFFMCLCCKFRLEGKYDDPSNSMLHPAVLTDLFLFYMWGSSLSISVLYRYLIIKSNSDPHPHFLLPCACLPNPHFLLPRARLPPSLVLVCCGMKFK